MYVYVLAAAAHIENVAIHINENIRKQENFYKMLSIQNSLTGLISVPSIISPARSFIKEGKIMKVAIYSIVAINVANCIIRYVVVKLRKELYFYFLTCYYMQNKIC